MSATDYDALVIGYSPGGGSVVTYLARSGKCVLVPRITFAPLRALNPPGRQHPAKV